VDGGIFGLLGLIASHRGAVEYDFRTRFGYGLSEVGARITITEAARLVVIVRQDPSSAIAAALEGWTHPISREALILMDLFDLDMQVATGRKGKPKPHPGRPWQPDDRSVKRHGDTAGRSRAEVVAILNAHGHQLPV
jgi:hypothetical protein